MIHRESFSELLESIAGHFQRHRYEELKFVVENEYTLELEHCANAWGYELTTQHPSVLFAGCTFVKYKRKESA